MVAVLLVTSFFAVALNATHAQEFIAHCTEALLPPAALVRFEADGAVELAAPAGKIAAGKLVELRQQGRTRPAPPQANFVELTHGDSIPLEPAGAMHLDGSRLSITPARALNGGRLREISLYRPYVALLFFKLPGGVEDAESFLARLRRETRLRDVVFLHNGDRIEGNLTRLDAKEGCELDDDGRKTLIAWQRLAGIAWSTQRLARPRFRSAIAHAVLEGGGRINFTQLAYNAQARRWAGKTWYGDTAELGAERLIAIDAWHGAAVYLGDLSGRYEHTPYLGISWPLRVDGGALSAGADFFDRGLSVHTASRISYALEGQYRWFEAVAALDGKAGTRGRARLAVLIDGRRHEVGGKEEWSVRDGPVAVRLDVTGARSLTLVADFGTLGDVQGDVNWCNARLVKRD